MPRTWARGEDALPVAAGAPGHAPAGLAIERTGVDYADVGVVTDGAGVVVVETLWGACGARRRTADGSAPGDSLRRLPLAEGEEFMRAFGPVPSRRLGRSLGVNNIPPKSCSYACVYCQVGRTTHARIEPRVFYDPDDLVSEIRDKVRSARRVREDIDYITFVTDGEPTLDVNLGREIELLRPLGVKKAIISNASLVWRPEVRERLATADWVSLKVDAANEACWRKVNRPHRALALGDIFEGMIEFAKTCDGELVTETMLVRELNDDEDHLRGLAGFLSVLMPRTAYLSVPTRPPAEPWVEIPGTEAINRAYQIVSDRVPRTELLIGYEGNAFASTENVEEDLLSITAVHPMTEEAVKELLEKAHADEAVPRRLVEQGHLMRTSYRGKSFYLRRPCSVGAS